MLSWLNDKKDIRRRKKMPNADELALADKLRLAAARGQTQVVAQLRKQGAKFDVDRVSQLF